MTASVTVQVVGPVYAVAPLPRAHEPPKVSSKGGYAKYRSCLRLDFNNRCAYCLAHEVEVGPTLKYGGFEIEHFKPQGVRQFRRFANSYPNLLWACPTCNGAKLHKWPNDAELLLGMRFIDPTIEALGQYLSVNGTEVVPTTSAQHAPAAEYMIDEIRLNSATHKERRRRRKAISVKIATLEATLHLFRTRTASGDASTLNEISSTEKELSELSAMLGTGTPWDHPTSCLCPPPGTTVSAPAKPKRRRLQKRPRKRKA